MDVSAERREFEQGPLREEDAGDDPIALFARWLSEAHAASVLDPTAMTLASADASGKPSARIVLLKGYGAEGFDFFTRYSTRKGQDLADNPRAALLFHWRELSRQVRVEGPVQMLPRAASAAYFATRPRGSQLAAHAASGLSRVPDRASLEHRMHDEEQRWQGKEVALPEDWGGYRTTPLLLEFWQGRPNRLHDRLVYELSDAGAWQRYRLAP
jgi:pyridoxamine 5'-phosphate oxidase